MKDKDSQTRERGLAVVRTVAELRKAVAAFRAAGRTGGQVPTMGALHEGHVSLVAGALARGDAPAASIFVNPTQFGPNEDFAAYPRDEAGDFAKLEAAGCRIVFAPDKDEMYPTPILTTVKVTGVTDGLCGPFRPGHFEGVATVVTKLLMMAMPSRPWCATSPCRSRSWACRRCASPTDSRCRRATATSPPPSARRR